MKKYWLSALVVLGGITLKAQKVTPGMTAEAFKKAMPGIIPQPVSYTVQQKSRKPLTGFDGKWSLQVKNDTLARLRFESDLGTKPRPGCGAGYIRMADAFNGMYNIIPGQVVNPADTLLLYTGKHKNENDTLLLNVWDAPHVNVQAGIYHSGNPAGGNYHNMPPNADIETGAYHLWVDYRPPLTFLGRSIYEKSNWDYQDMFPNGIGLTGQWGRNESLYGLNGAWAYNFESGTLNWTMWDYYAGKHDEKTFNQCLEATRSMIAEYTKLYGAPKITKGTTKYRDPYKDKHWGYDVLKAVWKHETYTTEIEFYFMGGKGQYDLVVRVEEELTND